MYRSHDSIIMAKKTSTLYRQFIITLVEHEKTMTRDQSRLDHDDQHRKCPVEKNKNLELQK